MNTLTKRAALILMVGLGFGLMGDAAADKIDQTYVKSNIRTVSTSSFVVDEARKHEITQNVVVSDLKSSNPAFRVKEEWNYGHTDTIDGSGTETGYFIDTHEDGSITYGTYEGRIKTTSKPDGSWESASEGTYKYTGGSGKYKNIKGNGTYKFTQPSTGHGREEGRETIEF